MKLRFVLMAMTLALLASCAGSDEASLNDRPQPSQPSDGRYAVGFNAYASRSVSHTRAGLAGALDLTALEQDKLSGGGFGVFAYYTDLKKYDQTGIPNFMYNQGVFKNGANWEYTPVMYWPNEYGADANSDDEDKVSFFAYAPYVHHASAAAGSVDGDATWGITGFSRNTTAGDPVVKYIASFDPVKSVDLCWGVCDNTSWNRIQGNGSQTMTKGLPWLDVEHPQGIDQKMTFTFKHALSQLNVQIDADADALTHADGQEIDGNTRIYVRSISFTGIAMKGALNLNNTVGGDKPQALWLDYSGSTDLPFGESVTVKDGRRDGREGSAGAEAANEVPTGLNQKIIQKDGAQQGFTQPGVTHTTVNLFDSDDLDKCVYVIPTGEQMIVNIIYDVETVNPHLSSYISDGTTNGVSIENKVSKTIVFPTTTGLACGNKYTLKLHLGMNTVKFDADVSAWDDGDAVNGTGWLPGNLAVDAPVTLSLGTSMTMALSGGTGSPQTLTATTKPAGMDVNWTNSDDGVATIAPAVAPSRAGSRASQAIGPCPSIVITPVAAGTTIITATSAAGSAQCVVTVTDESTLQVTSGVNNWGNGGNVDDVTIEDPGVALASATVGMVIGANGKAYNTIAQANTYTTAAAIIAYKGNGEGNSSYNTGLAISLEDVAGTKKWKSSNDGTCTAQNDDFDIIIEDLNGLAHTATLCSAGHSSHGHDAAVAANGYTSTMAKPANCSTWFLPTIGQWKLIAEAMCGGTGTFSQTYTYNSANFNKKIRTAYGVSESTTCAGDVHASDFWSSVEYDADYAWLVRFGSGGPDYYCKDGTLYVRPVLAF